MTVLYTDLAVKEESPDMGDYIRANIGNGKLRSAEVQFLIAAGFATNDTILLKKLPAGARLLVDLCSISCEDPGTALIIDIGDDDATADADRYVDGLDLSAGGNFTFLSAEGVALLDAHIVEQESWIIADCKTVTTPTVGQKVTFHLYWVED